MTRIGEKRRKQLKKRRRSYVDKSKREKDIYGKVENKVKHGGAERGRKRQRASVTAKKLIAIKYE